MVDKLLEKVKASSKEEISSASEALARFATGRDRTIGDAVKLLEHAGEAYPQDEHKIFDLGCNVIWAARTIAADRNASALLPTILAVFPGLSPQRKQAALSIVTMMDTAEAGRAFVDLLRDFGEELSGQYIIPFRKTTSPAVANALFPALLREVRRPELRHMIYDALLQFRKSDAISDELPADCEQQMSADLSAELAEVIRLQQAEGVGWKDEYPYGDHRNIVGLLFDIAGAFDSNALVHITRNASDLIDPRLRRFRAIAMLSTGQHVTDDELGWIARSPRDRYWLFDQLVDLELESRLPAACLDQQLLAQGHLVDWLCFGTELGREPDEIELVHQETRKRSSGFTLIKWHAKREPVDYYFFKFRVTEEHWSKKDGWMVGVAGGYARAQQPTTLHDGSTFSHFTSYEAKSLDKHIAEYLQ